MTALSSLGGQQFSCSTSLGDTTMGNLDFSNHTGFSWYVILLVISGIAMMGLAFVAAKPLTRLLNLLFGVGFVVYGVYLGWVWQGGTYVIFFKAFILPVVLIYATLRTGIAKRKARGSAISPAPTQSNPTQSPTEPPSSVA
jgi:hypothetical protein